MSEEKKVRVKNSEAFGAKRTHETHERSTANEVSLPQGSRKNTKRLGRGPGSGVGKTSARGQKGQRARAASMKRGFEGGQMPIHRRLPKRGFTSRNHKLYQPVNLADIERHGLTGEITPEMLKSKGIVKDPSLLIKVLGNGEIKSAIQITVDKASKSALEKIQASGGSVAIREAKKKQESDKA
ncbi:MAG: 50S ribosomal protein L15 [Spirochaetota bacterium]